MARRSRKRYEGWRRKYVGDLKHMLRCCQRSRLPDPDHSRQRYLAAVLASAKLPSPKDVAEQVQLLNVEREANRLWSIPPIDMTKADLAEQRKEKDRMRKMMVRRKAGNNSREGYLARFANSINKLKPWIAEGISRPTWFRNKAKAEAVRLGSSEVLNEVRLGSSAPTYTKSGTTQYHPHPIPLQKGLQAKPVSPPFTDRHRRYLIAWAVAQIALESH